MDKRVKERITGAVVLVALIVIAVPEMFGGRDRKPVATTVDPVAGTASGEGPPLRSYTIEVEPREGRQPGASAPAAPQVAESPAAAPAIAARSAPAPVPTVPEVPRTPVAPAPERAASASVPAEPAVRTGGWYVQLGVFAQRVNAERFSQDVGRKGYGAHVDAMKNSAGKELFRVRVGPVSDREEATKLQSRLGSDGFKGTLSGPT